MTEASKPTTEPAKRESGRTWKASWDEHRRIQLMLGVAATPAQRLAWLEEMIRIAYKSGALPRKSGPYG